MKKLKLFFMTMLLSAVSVNALAQTAGDTFTKTLEDGVTEMTFQVLSNTSNVSVLNCTSTASEVTVPQTIMDLDKTFNVTNITTVTGTTKWSSCITKVNLPEGITTFSYGVFNGANVETLELPASLTTISDLSFEYATKLTEITVRSGNTKYEAIDGILYSLGTNHALKCVPRAKTFSDGVLTIEEGTKTLGIRSVYNNKNITKIVFPSTMSIQDYALQRKDSDHAYYCIEDCSKLAEVEVASGNTEIYAEDNVVFAYDENNTLLFFPPARVNEKNSENKTIYTVPDGVKAIADYACIDAQFQIIGLNEVETIGELAFNGCNKLTGVSLSHNMSVISEGALRGTNIENFYMDGELTGGSDYFYVQDGVLFSADKTVLIQFPLGRTGEYEIPSGTTEIAGYAFSGSSLSDVTIPESVTSIGDHAFSSVKNITSIVIPEGVTSFGDAVFTGATGLEEVTLPSTLKVIPFSTFYGCTSLATFNFAEGLEQISDRAFYHCPFTEITLPASLKTLSVGALRGLSKLEKVTFADNSQLTTIGTKVFAECNSLKTVDFGENSSLTTIGTQAFADLPALEEMTIPASVTDIEARAFGNTPALATVTFEEPSSLTTIKAGAFADCGLTSLEIPDAVTTIEREAFRNCNVLEEITLSENVSTISAEAFKFCTNLTAINVPSENPKYSSVDGMLLSKDKETLVLFPAGKANKEFTLLAPSITKIGDYAFYYCENLENVTIPNKVTEIGSRAFILVFRDL